MTPYQLRELISLRECLESDSFDEIMLSSHWAKEPRTYKCFRISVLREVLVPAIQHAIDNTVEKRKGLDDLTRLAEEMPGGYR